MTFRKEAPKMFENLSLKHKILAGALLPVILMGLVNLIAISNFSNVVSSFEIVDHNMVLYVKKLES